MKLIKTAVILAFLLMAASPAFAAEKESAYDRVMRTGVIRCGYMPWPPFFDVDPNTGELGGLNREIFDQVFKLLDLKVQYVEVTLGFHVNELNEGKVDAICGDGPWIISAAKQVDYGDAYVYQPVYVYVRAAEIRADMDNAGVTFAGIDGDLSVDLKNFRFPKAKMHSLPSLSDPTALMMEVITGKADAAIIDSMSARRILETNPGRLKRLGGGKPLAVYPNTFSVAKGEDKLLKTINAGVAAALDIGLVDAILGKYDPAGNLLQVNKPYMK